MPFCSTTTNLGHLIIYQGVSTDPNKIKDAQQWSTPSNVRGEILGLATYYLKHVKIIWNYQETSLVYSKNQAFQECWLFQTSPNQLW